MCALISLRIGVNPDDFSAVSRPAVGSGLINDFAERWVQFRDLENVGLEIGSVTSWQRTFIGR